MTTNDQQSVSLREFFDEKFKRLEEQNELSIQLGRSTLAEQKKTNGRVDNAEKSVAVLQWQFSIVAAMSGAVFAAAVIWAFSKLP